MLTRPTVVSVLLIAILATSSPWQMMCFGGAASKQQPADQPLKDNEQKEETSEKSELKDVDDFKAFTVVGSDLGWGSRTWTLHDLSIRLSCRIFRHGPDHCRAPPADFS